MSPSVAAPLHQVKGHLINKGYSYSEVKEDGAVIVIFKASADDLQNDLICMPPITNN